MRLSKETYPDDDCDYRPVCSKCDRPVGPLTGLIIDYLDSVWLCDSCAAAAENNSDARLEQRRYDP